MLLTEIKLNGRNVGEIGFNAALAGHFNVPVARTFMPKANYVFTTIRRQLTVPSRCLGLDSRPVYGLN